MDPSLLAHVLSLALPLGIGLSGISLWHWRRWRRHRRFLEVALPPLPAWITHNVDLRRQPLPADFDLITQSLAAPDWLRSAKKIRYPVVDPNFTITIGVVDDADYGSVVLVHGPNDMRAFVLAVLISRYGQANVRYAMPKHSFWAYVPTLKNPADNQAWQEWRELIGRM
jgi:hypothetical protein